jgi:hypothetical protein
MRKEKNEKRERERERESKSRKEESLMQARAQERAISEQFISSRRFAGARARPSRPFDRPFLPDAASSPRSRFYSAIAYEGREKGDVRR